MLDETARRTHVRSSAIMRERALCTMRAFWGGGVGGTILPICTAKGAQLKLFTALDVVVALVAGEWSDFASVTRMVRVAVYTRGCAQM